jgi:hypothetical protein
MKKTVSKSGWHQSQENHPTKSHNISSKGSCWQILPLKKKEAVFFSGLKRVSWVWLTKSCNVMKWAYGSNTSERTQENASD